MQIIDNALSFIEQTKKQLENLSYQSSKVDELNLRLEVKVIRKISQIFPIYFDNQIEINDQINFLKTITYKLHEKPKSCHMGCCIERKHQMRNSREEINSLSLVQSLLRQIMVEYKKILSLLKFMQESQSNNFQYYECNYAKQVYHKFLSLFKKDHEFQNCQSLLKEVKNKHNSSNIC